MAAPRGIDKKMAGIAIEPTKRPIWKLLKPNCLVSSGISGGTAKKVVATAKKLITAEIRINQRLVGGAGVVSITVGV